MNFIIFWLLNLRVKWMLIVFWKKAMSLNSSYMVLLMSPVSILPKIFPSSNSNLSPTLKRIYFWLCWVFVAAQTFLQLWQVGTTLQLWCIGFSLRGFSCGRTRAPESEDCSSCSTWVQQFQLLGSRAQAQQLWYMGLVVLSHVASSLAKDLTRVSCISRQILYH